MNVNGGVRLSHNVSIYVVAVLIALLVAVALVDSVYAEPGSSGKFVGAWKVYKDDDKPGEKMAEEVMSFWPDGKFSITADTSYIGLYRVNGEKLQLLVKIDDKALPVERVFKFTSMGLQFKNDKTGWVYYKRISETPQGKKPEL